MAGRISAGQEGAPCALTSACLTGLAELAVNDRVGRQACFHAVPVRSMALSVTTSLRMQAVSASLAGFPAARRRPEKAAIAGLPARTAATAAMDRQARRAARPP